MSVPVALAPQTRWWRPREYPDSVTQDLIVYEEPATWMPLVRDFLMPRLRPGGLAHRRKRRLDRMDIDDPDWLRLLALGMKVPLDTVEEEFSSVLKSRSALDYHGCRPIDLASYLADGIKAFDSSELAQLLQDAVQRVGVRRLGEEILALGRTRLSQHTDSVVYLVLDQRHLLCHAGHYLIYGSEWLCSAFAENRALLRNIGVPTLLKVMFPLILASPRDRKQLARNLLHEWTRLSAIRLQESRPVDFSFAVRQRIPAEMIVGHSHPSTINDPLGGGREYLNCYLTCQYCVPK